MARTLAACALACSVIPGGCTEPRATSHSGTYVLVSYKGSSPPTRLAGDVFILSAALTLQSNSRWMSTETDSNTTSTQRVSQAAGGTWSAKGTVLTLTDTTAAAAGRSFVATITDQAIEFPAVPSRFERQ